MQAKLLTPWKASRGPIRADRFALEAARTVDALLIEPIGVLPNAEGEIIRPFKIGIGLEIQQRLKPEVTVSNLRKALRRYTHSSSYPFAMAQPDAMRHDIAGDPVEPVSEQDRLNARQSFVVIRARREQLRKEREATQTSNASSITESEPSRRQ
ncbi:ProQ/FinO family protein [Neorhizobium sp. DT-125]|uniref:ProQ/FinO family protein n=1 Tax=Neorhizobium sp. DT-125 TaxID=3396163 RepID=UPI003F1E0498